MEATMNTTERRTEGGYRKADLEKARMVFIGVLGKWDVLYAKITKVEAAYLLEKHTEQFDTVLREDGDFYIDNANQGG